MVGVRIAPFADDVMQNRCSKMEDWINKRTGPREKVSAQKGHNHHHDSRLHSINYA